MNYQFCIYAKGSTPAVSLSTAQLLFQIQQGGTVQIILFEMHHPSHLYGTHGREKNHCLTGTAGVFLRTILSNRLCVCAALSNSSLYSSSSQSRCRVFSGSFSSTGIATLERSFPMLFRRMFQRLILLVLGHGAGKHVLRWEWYSMVPSGTQSGRQMVGLSLSPYGLSQLPNSLIINTIFKILFLLCINVLFKGRASEPIQQPYEAGQAKEDLPFPYHSAFVFSI